MAGSKRDRKHITARQERFCLEYLKDRVGAAAYRRAGYRPRNGNVAAVQAHRLLRDPKVKARIDELEEERTRRTQMEADQVIHELAKIAFTSLYEVVYWDESTVRLRDSDTLHPDVLAAVRDVKMVECKESRSLSVVMHSKVGALKALARIKGLHDGGYQEPAPRVDFETIRAMLVEKLQRINERREATGSSYEPAGNRLS